jgi:hypothetical protein
MNNNLKYINRVGFALLGVMLRILLGNLFHFPEPLNWVIELLILYVLFTNFKRYNIGIVMDRPGYCLTVLLMGWFFIGFLRGANYAEGYWMWKGVANQLLLTFFYFVIVVSTDIKVVHRYFYLYFLLFVPMVVVSYLIDGTPLYLNYVTYTTLMLFVGLIPKKQRIFLIGIVFFFFLNNFQRNDLAKIMVTSLIGIAFSFFYIAIPKWSIKLAHFFLLSLPIVLLFLATTGGVNVFKMDEYIKGDYKQTVRTSAGVEEEDLTIDTRTFIFENVFYTMNRYDAWIFGRSTAFGDEGLIGGMGELNHETGLKGRFGNEVGIMDILLWYGIVGVVIYFLIYVRASYVAIYRSANRYSKAVGLHVAFLWAWSFIWEKPVFENFFMMDLILLGLCFSKSFRGMTDAEVGIWVRAIFVKKKNKFIRS